MFNGQPIISPPTFSASPSVNIESASAGEFIPPQDLQRAGHGKVAIRDGETDGLFANIQSKKALAGQKRGFHVVKLADRHMR
jgi:hypothetical protein